MQEPLVEDRGDVVVLQHLLVERPRAEQPPLASGLGNPSQTKALRQRHLNHMPTRHQHASLGSQGRACHSLNGGGQG